MPIIILKKSETTRKSIELGMSKDGGMHLKSSKVIQQPRKELYKVTFQQTTTQFSHPREKLIELLEWLAWLNSATKTQAESIGWVDDEKKLPIFDNNQLYLPHALFYDKFIDQEFLRTYCPHIRATAPTASDGIYGAQTKKGKVL